MVHSVQCFVTLTAYGQRCCSEAVWMWHFLSVGCTFGAVCKTCTEDMERQYQYCVLYNNEMILYMIMAYCCVECLSLHITYSPFWQILRYIRKTAISADCSVSALSVHCAYVWYIGVYWTVCTSGVSMWWSCHYNMFMICYFCHMLYYLQWDLLVCAQLFEIFYLPSVTQHCR